MHYSTDSEPLQFVLCRLKRVKRCRDGYVASCPVTTHGKGRGDRNPSLSIGLGSDGQVLLTCHAGCSRDAILAAMGLTSRDLYPRKDSLHVRRKRKPRMFYDSIDSAILALLRDPKLRGGREKHRYSYHTAEGELAFIVLRFNFEDGREKTFRPLHPVDDRWAIGDPPGLLPLYRLPDLREAGRIYIFEGEGPVDAAYPLGLTSTTSAHGSKSAHNTDWSPVRGKEIVVVPDNDNPGRAYARTVAEILLRLGCQVKIVELPGLPESGDIVDFVEARDSRESQEVRGMIETIVDAVPYEQTSRANESDPLDQWSDPQPLPGELPPVLPFGSELLPEALRPWIQDIADRVQCPPDFPAVAVMVALAAVVGRRVGIRPKQKDDWVVVSNLWGGVIGRPGILKTPAVQEALKPLLRLEVDAKREFGGLCEEHTVKQLVAQARRKVAAKDIEKAVKNGSDAESVARTSLKGEIEVPTRQRYVTNDCTVEKLGELLKENPNGLLAFRDELTGFLRSLDKDGQEGARAFYLEAWNGTGRFTYDRIGRGTIDIEAACVSILGGIQPGPLLAYLRSAVAGGGADDGLIQRFQLLVWPDVSKEWRNVDEWPDIDAKDNAYAVFTRLSDLNPAAVGAEHDKLERDGIPFLRFDSEAQRLFDEWRAALEQKVRSGTEHPAIESHLAKYRSLIPALALLSHLADGDVGPVGPAALERAIRWSRYLESHARRIYAAVIHPDIAAAKALTQRILAGHVKDGFSLRDIYRHGWTGLSAREDAERAVTALCDFDWLNEVKEKTAGRSRTRYFINPKIHEGSC